MIMRIWGMRLLPEAAELLNRCVDDVDEEGDGMESSKDVLQSLRRLAQDAGEDACAGIEMLSRQSLAGVYPPYFSETRGYDWSGERDPIWIPLGNLDGSYYESGDLRFCDVPELRSWVWLFAALSVPGARILGVCEEQNDAIEPDQSDDSIFLHWEAAGVERRGRNEFQEVPCRVVDTVQSGGSSCMLDEWAGERQPKRIAYRRGGTWSSMSSNYGPLSALYCTGRRVSVGPARLLKMSDFAERLNDGLSHASDYIDTPGQVLFPWHLQVIGGRLVRIDTNHRLSSLDDSLAEDRQRAQYFGVRLPVGTMSLSPLDDAQSRKLAQIVGEALNVGSRALVEMEAMVTRNGSRKTDYSVVGRIYAVEHCSDGVRVIEVDRQIQVQQAQEWVSSDEWLRQSTS